MIAISRNTVSDLYLLQLLSMDSEELNRIFVLIVAQSLHISSKTVGKCASIRVLGLCEVCLSNECQT